VSGDPTWDVDAFPAVVASNFTVGSHVAGYRLEQMIGRGGMAMVFRAVDERLGRQVALKILAPALAENEGFRRRFVAESRMAAAVDDPHIIPVHEAGEATGVLFIAMRYVPGGDVRTLVHQSGPLSAARTAAIISPVASALDAAHSFGLIHRDVKPANMLLDTRQGRPDHVYLSDFGLGKESVAPLGLTQTGQILGTPAYSSPEQIEGKPLDGRADEYSLACSTFELLTGAPPFVQTQIAALILAQMSAPPPALTSRRADLPASADRVFAKALAKKAEDRYASCREFADDLRHAFGMVPYDSGPDIIVPDVHQPTELASPGGRSTDDLAGHGGAARDTPTNVMRKRPQHDGGQENGVPPDGAEGGSDRAEGGADRQPEPPSSETLPADKAGRRPAVAASLLILVGAIAAIVSSFIPGPLSSGGKVILVPYLLAIVLAVVLLAGKGRAPVAAILLGLWAPAVAWLAADVVAVTADHSFDLTGGYLASYYVADLTDVLGVTAVFLLWRVWRSNPSATPGRSRRGLPAALVCGAGLVTAAQLIIFASFGTESGNNFSAYDYMFGVAGLVVGLATAWVATGVSNRTLSGMLLLGWAITMIVVPLDLFTLWSTLAAFVRVLSVLMLLLLLAFLALTIAALARRSSGQVSDTSPSVTA
jgi:serine/threonine protein kinase